MELAGMPSPCTAYREILRPFYPLYIRQMLDGFWYLSALEMDHSNPKGSVVLIALCSCSPSPSLLRALPRR